MDWKWEEYFGDQRVVLESGLVPTLRTRLRRQYSAWRLGGEVELAYGAVGYEGALQTINGGQQEYSSHTHYFAGNGEATAGWARPVGRHGVLVPSVRMGYHRWVRTIDSDRFNEPGIHGYVETWQHATVQPVIAAEIPLPKGDQLMLEAGLRLPLWTAETIGGLGGTSGPIELEPGTRPAFRAMLQLRLGRILLETEWMSLAFQTSPDVTVPMRVRSPDGIVRTQEMDLHQPASDLRRLDLRLGTWL